MRLGNWRWAAAAAATMALAAPLATPAAANAATCAPAAHAGGDWPTFGGDLRNTRSQPAEKALGAFEAATASKKFAVDIRQHGGTGGLLGTPIVAGGCVYAGTDEGFVIAANADDGQVVWTRKLTHRTASLAYAGGRVFATVAEAEGQTSFAPYVVALDAATGAQQWRTEPVDTLPGSELTGSPVPFDGMLLIGVSNFPGEDQGAADWYRAGQFRGSYLILDQATGALLHKQYLISDEEFCRDTAPSPTCTNRKESAQTYDGASGAGVWTTAAVDTETKYAYWGTGNPTSNVEHKHSNAIIKVDVDRSRPTFGQIVDSYKGDSDKLGPPDVDFGASPQLLEGADGRKLLAAYQKSATFHMIDRTTMDRVWALPLSARTGYVGHASTGALGPDGTIFQPAGPAEVLYKLSRDGLPLGLAPAPVTGYYGPATYANGVVWTGDTGVVKAYDTTTMAPIRLRWTGIDAQGSTMASVDAGVSIARKKVYVPAGDFLLAYGR